MQKLTTVYGMTNESLGLSPCLTSLILFRQNANGSNILTDPIESNYDFQLVSFYAKFFKELGEKIESGIKSSFVTIWKAEVDKITREMSKYLKNKYKNYELVNKETLPEHVDLVRMKFQGNLAEIFFEYFFRSGLGEDICTAMTYCPVKDPAHEEYYDAAGSNPNGEHVEIQIKNYMTSDHNWRMLFDKAISQLTKYMWANAKDLNLNQYIESPHAFIISFSDVTDDRVLEDFQDECRVAFLGPSYIDGKHIQGNIKTKTKGRYNDFYAIANQILDAEKELRKLFM